MEKKIKILHILTIIAIVAFCIMQSYWLYSRYSYTLQNYKDELYEKVIATLKQECEQRRGTSNPDITTLTNSMMTASGKGHSSNSVTWSFDVYTIDLRKYNVDDSLNVQKIVQEYDIDSSVGISKHQFIVNNPTHQSDVHQALELFCIDQRSPFVVERLDSLLRKSGIVSRTITTEKVDSMVWLPSRQDTESLMLPEMIVKYPYDVFEGQQVCITYSVGVSPVIKRMLETLLLSTLLSILLVVCLIIQISVIRRQRRVEQLRQDFIHTMIHELKRPISTLKMCLSFMRNEKLMQDEDSKQEVLTDSYKALENLSSYFSKLRDLSFNDVTEIPLNLSTFSINDLLYECVNKLDIPSGKDVILKTASDKDLMITADKMHLMNIINNLLENAVKYSLDKVSIEISCEQQSDDTVSISVSDDGIGINESECKYVFDKFFRSKAISGQNIPGIGLGLAYVQQLTAAHGGTISVTSQDGIGSIFTIKIPQ